MDTEIVLASSSKYRRELLSRLGFTFRSHPAQIEEAFLSNEAPQQASIRLARQKAESVANIYPNAIVIASDQVVDLNGKALSKPNQHDVARSQLRKMSGKSITFYSAVCVILQSKSKLNEFFVPTTVHFRELSATEIERYLLTEKPYDCAGAAKIEALGITLVKQVDSTDPTALIGLPLVQLAQVLREFGLHLP